MVGDQLAYMVLNNEDVKDTTNIWDSNDSRPIYIYPEALVLYEADSDTLDNSRNSPFTSLELVMCVEYDVYTSFMYKPAFSSRRTFRDFQLTKNVSDIVHMYVFCQSAKTWTYDIHVL